jgi:cellulose synthase operon protein C
MAAIAIRGHFRWKTIAVFGVLLGAAATGYFFLHRSQVRFLDARFLSQAKHDEEKGNLDRAARFYRLYLFLKGDDLVARSEFAKLKEKMALNGAALNDALNDYEDVLAKDRLAGKQVLDTSTKNDLLLRAARIDIRIRKFDAASGYLAQLDETARSDSEAQFALAQCLIASQQFSKAKECCWNVIDKDKNKLAAYAQLAGLMQAEAKKEESSKSPPITKKADPKDSSGRPNKPDEVINLVVRNNPNDFQAYLMRAEFRQDSAGRKLAAKSDNAIEDAIDQDYAEARKLAPENYLVLMACANRLTAKTRNEKSEAKRDALLAEARGYLKHAADLSPHDARITSARVDVEMANGRVSDAADLLRLRLKSAVGKEREGLYWRLATLLIDANQIDRAADVVAAMEASDPRIPFARFLRGRLFMAKRQWHLAAQMLDAGRSVLETAVSSAVDTNVLLLQTDMLLAECALKLEDPEKQLGYLRRAKKLAPGNAAVLLSLARAIAATGRVSDAMAECERLLQAPSHPLDAEVLYARLTIFAAIILPAESRRWDEVDARLNELAKKNPQLLDLQLSRIDSAAAQKKYDRAWLILDALIGESPKRHQLWAARANLALAEGNKAKAAKILEEAKEKAGDDVSLVLSKLRLVPEAKAEAEKQLGNLKKDLDEIELAQQPPALGSLAIAFERVGDNNNAETLWTRLAEIEKGNLTRSQMLFEFYERTANIDGMARTQRAVESVEGEGGPIGHVDMAVVDMVRARQKDSPADLRKQLLADARGHLAAAAAQRPRWYRIPELRASIAEDDDTALVQLRTAVAQGNRRPAVLRQFAGRLVENGMSGEAEDLVRKLKAEGSMTDEFRKVAAEISLLGKNEEQTIDLATSAIPLNSKDPRELLWQARIFATLGKYAEAESHAARSLELANDSAEAWVVLVEGQAKLGKVDKARDSIEKMQAKVPSDKLLLALGQCLQSVGDMAGAGEAFKKAFESQPDDWLVLQANSDFYRTGAKPEMAESYLRRILDPKSNAPRLAVQLARRNLAIVLAMRNDLASLQQAVGLVEENLRTNRLSVDDQIAKGSLLALIPGHRQESIALLRDAAKSRPPNLQQMVLLANLYEAAGNWPECRQCLVRMTAMSSKADNYPSILSAYVGKLLAHEEVSEAGVLLQELRELRPHAASTAERVARFNAIQDRPTEILATLKAYLDDKQSEPNDSETRSAIAAQVFSNLLKDFPKLRAKDSIFLDEATRILESHAGAFGKRENLLPLASFYGHANNPAKCLQICESILTDVAAQRVLGVAVAAASDNAMSQEQFERIGKWIADARKKNPELVDWDIFSAILCEHWGKYSAAKDFYRSALARVPQHLIVMNNLAVLEGLLDRNANALNLIDQAVSASERNPEILDSRAVILMAQNKHADAGKDLRESLGHQRTPTRMFHLAQLEDRSGNTNKAIAAFREANRLGLRIDSLHPLERNACRDLARKLLVGSDMSH